MKMKVGVAALLAAFMTIDRALAGYFNIVPPPSPPPPPIPEFDGSSAIAVIALLASVAAVVVGRARS